MRRALNENPTVQIVVLGVLAVLVAFFLLTRLSGGSSSPPANSTTTPTSDTAATSGAPAPTTPATGIAPAPTATAGTATPPPATATPTGKFEAGPGLPAPVVKAYDANKVVAIAVVRRGGVDDKAVAPDAQDSQTPDVALFVVPAKNVAHYSRIAQGVDLNRTPALIVLRQKKLTHGSAPKASIYYGFRGVDSIVQALHDARYRGANHLPYFPK